MKCRPPPVDGVIAGGKRARVDELEHPWLPQDLLYGEIMQYIDNAPAFALLATLNRDMYARVARGMPEQWTRVTSFPWPELAATERLHSFCTVPCRFRDYYARLVQGVVHRIEALVKPVQFYDGIKLYGTFVDSGLSVEVDMRSGKSVILHPGSDTWAYEYLTDLAKHADFSSPHSEDIAAFLTACLTHISVRAEWSVLFQESRNEQRWRMHKAAVPAWKWVCERLDGVVLSCTLPLGGFIEKPADPNIATPVSGTMAVEADADESLQRGSGSVVYRDKDGRRWRIREESLPVWKRIRGSLSNAVLPCILPPVELVEQLAGGPTAAATPVSSGPIVAAAAAPADELSSSAPDKPRSRIAVFVAKFPRRLPTCPCRRFKPPVQ